MAVAVVLAVVMAVGLFIGVPSGVEWLTGKLIGFDQAAAANAAWKGVTVTVVGGLTKVALLIGYMAVVGLMPEIRRTFQYHGAEH